MYVGVIFNLITGIIPVILYYSSLIPTGWGIATIIPLYSPMVIYTAIIPHIIPLGLKNILSNSSGRILGLIILIIISLLYYGGIGTVAGYFLSKIIENQKEPLQKEKDISGEDI